MLPFSAVGDKGDVYWIAEALTLDCIHILSRATELRVISAASAFRYPGETTDARAAGEALRAGYVLKGELEDRQQVYRILLHLFRTHDGKRIWSKAIDRSQPELIRTHLEVSRDVSRELRVPFPERPARNYTSDLDAHWAYWQGLVERRKPSGDAGIAVQYFQQALEKDSYFVSAQIRLAEALLAELRHLTVPPVEQMAKARDAARRATQLDPLSGLAKVVYAEMLGWYDWQLAAAGPHLVDAMQVQPSLCEAPAAYAMLLTASGRFDEALRQQDVLRLLDPAHDPQESLLWTLVSARRWDDLAKEAARLDTPVSKTLEALAWSMKGDQTKALEMATTAREQADDLLRAHLTLVYRNAGRKDDVGEIASSVKGFAQACALAVAGDKPTALTAYEEAVRTGDPLVSWSKVTPLLDSLRGDERFEKMVPLKI